MSKSGAPWHSCGSCWADIGLAKMASVQEAGDVSGGGGWGGVVVEEEDAGRSEGKGEDGGRGLCRSHRI